MSDITKISLVDLVTNIKNKSISCEEVTSAYINRINKSKKLNCYIESDFEQAINKAKSLVCRDSPVPKDFDPKCLLRPGVSSSNSVPAP